MDYLEEATKIWREFVPPSGQADTVQGELVRAVEKLRDEAIRNGNGNWDAGFEILLSYLEKHLLDTRIWPEDVVARTKLILNRLADYEDPLLEDEPYNELSDRVVDYFHYHGSAPHLNNPALYR